MRQNFFTNLPPEIKLEILSRLSIGSVFKCKLVDRSWRSLIESPEFANSYKSSPCLAVSERLVELPYLYSVYKVEDGDGNSKNSCKEAFNFTFPHSVPIHTSVNGLLFMTGHYYLGVHVHNMYICNPVTREYITITSPEDNDPDVNYSYGFGVSRNSGQFKVVRIFDQWTEEEDDDDWRVGCQVYTVGTRLWRSVSRDNKLVLMYRDNMVGKFLNGNFHWLASGKNGGSWISCLDLETELFTTFHAPRALGCSLCVVRDCLGVGDYLSRDEIVIWLMKDYGDDKSWTKQFVIPETSRDLSCLIHVFKDGDILFKKLGKRTSCYPNKTKAIEETTDLPNLHEYGLPMLVSYTPSFLPLETFSSTESVTSFCSNVYSF